MVKLLPSSMLSACGVSVYVGSGVRLVSLIVNGSLVTNTVPVVLTERTDTVNVCSPSVVVSSVGTTENDPVLLVIENDPLAVAKSSALVSIVQ